ncbi:HAD family hydrolase [Hespellia stercorisuis]|uniref:Haloacid dehalogenase superfamily, subfamily IA, variant 3 with third motif having DD or ED n=1 Tax=Hespellia stercorisuis DSM 15480 TaxID=1121950 RepID=A0A1M6HTA1_9FIRM|nr:HAD family phosphatase [Hespellia stercorisuis]SHJ25442.1 haloacid dehalogenase superfamily, subfamily IA, variant 3 with third motif having DD or ED [Hespellia stercorisuis DSM 15480]
MIKGIVFDMDGVIFDTERLSTEGWMKAGQEIGIDIPREFIMSYKGTAVGYSKQLYLDRYGADFDYDGARAIRTAYMDSVIEKEGVPTKKGLYELLEFSRERGLRLAVATSSHRAYAERLLRMAGIYELFDAVVYGDSVEKSKPDPDIFLKAIAQLQLTPEECFIIEDSTSGIRAGNASGASVIHIPDQVNVEEELRRSCYAVLDDLSQVISVVEKKN